MRARLVPFVAGAILAAAFAWQLSTFEAGPGAVPFRAAAPATETPLPAARWVEVIVVDADTNVPIANASVRASSDESGASASGRTDKEGHARVGPIGPGRISGSAEASNYVRDQFEMDAVEGPRGPIATVRLEKAGRIAGLVIRPDGEPAAGAAVELKLTRAPGEATGTTVLADRNGAFAFENLGEADRTVRATIETENLSSATIPTRKGDVGLRLRLGARAVVARVLDPNGSPVPWADASFSYVTPKRIALLPRPVEKGRLVIDVEDDDVKSGSLVVEKAVDADGKRLPLGDIRVEGVVPGEEIVVRLPREQAIEGRVIGPEGHGVAGAEVRAQRALRDEPIDTQSPRSWMFEVARTDDTGRFRIGLLGEGSYWVVALTPAPFVPSKIIRIDAGTTDAEFQLRTSTPVVVTVLDPEGRTVAGAYVVAARPEYLLHGLFSGTSGWSEGKTGKDGSIRMHELEPGVDYVLGVRGPVAASWADVVKRAWRPADTTVRLVAGLPVSGLVRGEDGQTQQGLGVTCTEANGVSRTVYTGADGTFHFTGLAAGSVRLEASLHADLDVRKPLRAEATVEAGAEGVELRLK